MATHEFTESEFAILELVSEQATALGSLVPDNPSAMDVVWSLVDRGLITIGEVDERSEPWSRRELSTSAARLAIQSVALKNDVWYEAASTRAGIAAYQRAYDERTRGQ